MPKRRNGIWEHAWMVMVVQRDGEVIVSDICDDEDVAWATYQELSKTERLVHYCEVYRFIPRVKPIRQ